VKSGRLRLNTFRTELEKQTQVISLMFAYKLKYPENFFMLRGNHESQSITRVYGFYDECKRRISVKVWKALCDAFMCLPVCSVVEEKIMCMHGGYILIASGNFRLLS